MKRMVVWCVAVAAMLVTSAATAQTRSIDCTKEGMQYANAIVKGSKKLGRGYWIPEVGSTIDLSDRALGRKKKATVTKRGSVTRWNRVHLVRDVPKKDGTYVEVSFGGKVAADMRVTVCSYLLRGGRPWAVRSKGGQTVTLKKGQDAKARFGLTRAGSSYDRAVHLVWISPASSMSRDRGAYNVRARRQGGDRSWSRKE